MKVLRSCIVNQTLGLQIPSKKVLWGVFWGLNTSLEGIWSPREMKQPSNNYKKRQYGR